MIDLNYYGWNDKLNQLKQESTYGTLTHGRVTIVHRTCYEVVAGSGVFRCELTGNMMYGKSDFELPCTGDWVIFQPFDEGWGLSWICCLGHVLCVVGKSERLPKNKP